MDARLRLILALLGSCCLSISQAQIVDDFASGGWERFASTPGTVTARQGSLHLVDSREGPAWVTVSKTFKVNTDNLPICLVKVEKLSDRGTVKLIRKEPYDKRVALQIDRPGLYAVDVHERFGWTGECAIEVCLYAIGDEEEITYQYVKWVPDLTETEKQLVAERDAGGNIALDVADFETVPLFTTCSYYLRGPRHEALSVQYRRTSDKNWQRAFAPVYVEADTMYRGSIVHLEEDTAYELRLINENETVLNRTTFRTWSSDVPVGRTIMLDGASFNGNLEVRESGSPDGWLKITAKPGVVLRNDRTGPLIELYKARYVILEGLVLRGGLKEAISIIKCDHVRVINCDIAGWGRIGTQRFDKDGKFYTAEGQAINWDSAILLRRSSNTVIERCYIHDPVSTANSWYTSHPAGPQAVGIDKPRSTVIRYNDFIGSDEHRWNDAMEGAGNFHIDGGFYRDADIVGNMVIFANDDAVEIDGGQTNVRVFQNKFEGCLCGVSIQGCMSGPSYVFHNLLVNMGDERGRGGQTIKTSSYANGPGAVSFIFGNTCYGDSSDLRLVHNLQIVAKNNIFAGRNAISGRQGSPQSQCDYNLLANGTAEEEPHGIAADPAFVDAAAGLFSLRQDSPAIGAGIAIDNIYRDGRGPVDLGAIPADSDTVLPARPIPVYLDRYQLNFSAEDIDNASGQTVTATVRGNEFASDYSIAQNSSFDWFTVTPENGTFTSETIQKFQVTPIPARMTERRLYRGAFLIRLSNGYSRPVVVYAETDVKQPVKPSHPHTRTTWLEAETPSDGYRYETRADPEASNGKCMVLSGPAREDPVRYRFQIPEAGIYFVALRVKSDPPVSSHNSLFFRVDDGPLDQAQLDSASVWRWSLAAHNRRQGLSCLQPFELAAGEHVIELVPREELAVDLIAITSNPAAFEWH